MPRKFQLYWDKHNKYWFRKFNGKKVYFGKGKSKYLDVESYNEAVAKYEEYLEEQRANLVKKNRADMYRVDSKWQRPKNTIAGAIDRYYVMQQRRQRRGDISIARVKALRSSLRVFERFCGTGKTSKTYQENGVKTYMNHTRMTGYFKHLENKVNKGEYVTLTAHMHWCIANDFLKFCYEQEWLDKLPRGLNRYKFNQRRATKGGKQIKVFSTSQVRELFIHARDRSILPMDLFIALAVNCGFTSREIGTLELSHLQWDADGKTVVKIAKRRSKTNQYGEWLLWGSTRELLKRWLEYRKLITAGMSDNDLVFCGTGGQPLNSSVETVREGSGRSVVHRETGYVNDAIGRNFSRMVKTHFPEMAGLSFKTLRSTGVSQLVKLNLNNTLLIEQLYLAHKPISTARIFYSRIEADTLDGALVKLENVFDLQSLVETGKQKDERKRVEHNARKRRERAARKKKLASGD